MKTERTDFLRMSDKWTGLVWGLSRGLNLLIMVACLAASATMSHASFVGLTNATASFEQTVGTINSPDDYRIWKSIDGLYGNVEGWGLYPNVSSNQTAVFQTVNPGAAGSKWFFDLYFYQSSAGHKIQKFRLSVTTSSNPTVDSGATWMILHPSEVSTNWGGVSLTATINLDDTVLVSGLDETSTPVQNAQWTVHASSRLTGITGFRLEVFPVDNDGDGLATVGWQTQSCSSCHSNPGQDGNIVLTEFTVRAVPLPSTLSLVLVGAGLLWARRRRRIT
jgi:hypothetical protein